MYRQAYFYLNVDDHIVVLVINFPCQMRQPDMRALLIWLLTLNAIGLLYAVKLSDERVVFQTAYGDIEFGVYPDVRTCHSRKKALACLFGCCTSIS